MPLPGVVGEKYAKIAYALAINIPGSTNAIFINFG
jgi:hypothetical protein